MITEAEDEIMPYLDPTEDWDTYYPVAVGTADSIIRHLLEGDKEIEPFAREWLRKHDERLNHVFGGKVDNG